MSWLETYIKSLSTQCSIAVLYGEGILVNTIKRFG